MDKQITQDLADIVGENYVTDKVYERKLYDHDIAPLPSEISIIFNTLPDIVIKPRTVEETSEIVKYANLHGIPIIPRGASSWGYGGTIPTKGGIVLELKELKQIKNLDLENMTVTVGAGIRWKTLLDYLEENGLTFNVYPSSALSATVGGWIATGGLGIGSLKYGHLREHIKEMKVVTPTGEIITLSKEKIGNSKMFDSIIGSEGTLGLITEVTLSIHEKPEKIQPLLIAFDDVETLVDLIKKVVKMPVKPFFIEIQDRDYLAIKRSINLTAPDVSFLALFVYEGPAEQIEINSEYLKRLAQEMKGVLLPDELAEEEWDERFYYMRIRRAGPTLLAGEITNPLTKLQYVIDETKKIKDKHNLRMGIKCFMVSEDTVLFMPMYLADERKRWKFLSLLPIVNEITSVGLKAGGAPYGFGIWNSFFLKDVFGDSKVNEMKAFKKKIDPKNIMNPGKMYKVETKFGIPLWGFTFRVFTTFLGVLKYF
jgi:glycolate oxidase